MLRRINQEIFIVETHHSIPYFSNCYACLSYESCEMQVLQTKVYLWVYVETGFRYRLAQSFVRFVLLLGFLLATL